MAIRTNDTSAMPGDRYWASVERDDLPAILHAKATSFRDRLEREGRVDIWRRSERTYYGLDGSGGWGTSTAVQFGGDDGELVLARVNHYRSIAQALLSMAGSQRPAFVAHAVNNDAAALEQVSLAQDVVDYVYRSKKLEERHSDALEMAIVCGEGYVHLRWDLFSGRVAGTKPRPVYDDNGQPVMEEVVSTAQEPQIDPETGQEVVVEVEIRDTKPKMEDRQVREGDIVPHVLGPLEVVRDLDEQGAWTWCLVPHTENVWNLAARYPQYRAHLLELRGQERWPRRVWGESTWETPEEDDDRVTVWCFYHLATDAMPRGRYAVVVGELVLADEAWSLDEIPVYGIVPQRQMGTGSGYAPMWDLLCLQEVFDSVFTSVTSAHENVGIQNVIAPKGVDLDAEMIGRALQLLEYDADAMPQGGRIEGLNLLQIAADSWKLMDAVERMMETISGVNSTARGNPQAQLKSGAALALVSSLAVQFNSAVQGEGAHAHERLGTGSLKLHQAFATNERVVEMAGKDAAGASRSFSADKLRGIARVTIELGNPLMRQRGFQLEVADKMFDKGQIDRDEYLAFFVTGRLEARFNTAKDTDIQIRRENELLAAGRPVPVMDTDDDVLHVRGHRRIFDDALIRGDAMRAKATLDHIKAHRAALDTKDVEFMWLIGQEVPPWRMPAEGEPSPKDAPPPPGAGEAPPGPDPSRARPLGAQPGAGPFPGDEQPNLPRMPTNPLTGQTAPQPGDA